MRYGHHHIDVHILNVVCVQRLINNICNVCGALGATKKCAEPIVADQDVALCAEQTGKAAKSIGNVRHEWFYRRLDDTTRRSLVCNFATNIDKLRGVWNCHCRLRASRDRNHRWGGIVGLYDFLFYKNKASQKTRR